ncbi:MAG: RNA polymerase sigma factor [Saprospiraceae bacterium]|nr:RNA polymerase sigma factor [Bacteroidia bacterium]NNE14147.1 RNA polymerase sigma factor [Saprospiraceae bacterium]NNL90940.1 RNA polymerase sigma factor [Saprospiraceae bacterium]
MLSNDKLFDKGFEYLVNKYQERLYWHIRKMVHFHEDADDVIQNTFLKVFKSIKGFKSQSKLYTWMYRIATNETINYLNKNKKHIHQNMNDALNEFENKLKSDEYFDGDKAQLLLAKGIEQLPAKQKQVFIMRYYDDLSYNDISEILNVTVGSLKASFHHAMKKVETYLKENVSYV